MSGCLLPHHGIIGASGNGGGGGNFVHIVEHDYEYMELAGRYWIKENVQELSVAHSGYNNPLYPQAVWYKWSEAQSMCPQGWRIPNYNDFVALANLVGGINVCSIPLRTTSGWNSNQGTDILGIGLAPTGYRSQDAKYMFACWLSDKYYFYVRCDANKGSKSPYPYGDNDFFAVRYVKDV